MKFGFIAKHRSIWPVAWQCEALGVSRSGFHAWLNRPRSARALTDEAIMPTVRSSFVASARTYGARRVWRDVSGGWRIMRPAQDRTADARGGAAGTSTSTWSSEGRGRAVGLASLQRARSPVQGGAAEPEMDRRLHLHLDGRGVALRRGRDRSVLAPCRRLVDERPR